MVSEIRRYLLIAAMVIGSLSGASSPARAQGSETAQAGWAAVPGILARIIPPTFPDRDFTITSFGAAGDGQSDSTEAIRKAIEACAAAGGGRVVVPRGLFLTGAIHLKSNVNHLAEGAVLKFSVDPKRYLPVVYTRFEGTECLNYSPLIYAFEQQNVAVTGPGMYSWRQVAALQIAQAGVAAVCASCAP